MLTSVAERKHNIENANGKNAWAKTSCQGKDGRQASTGEGKAHCMLMRRVAGEEAGRALVQGKHKGSRQRAAAAGQQCSGRPALALVLRPGGCLAFPAAVVDRAAAGAGAQAHCFLAAAGALVSAAHCVPLLG